MVQECPCFGNLWQLLLPPVPAKVLAQSWHEVSNQASSSQQEKGKRDLFWKEGQRVDFVGEKKIFLLTFSTASMAFSGENLNTKIFEPKYEVFHFGSLGQVWAAQFLTAKQHIFALSFFPSSFTEC